ncbi:glycosyltransferase involved in cell wall biosynthesis [Deinobacterium chartae]|uniref:Glycosyltransferase involved in cell wall biosynthesis n=1 Tax=Deinobacterium chartae TaxID=521158 RepID=A0A841HZY0_9DEIO|nr:glycosyltransferase [Deinobacterium chartae]MBB6097760.1 glycosyltransferase involved in cell wall biosynthesis [Deinobacterium chartae]
MTVSPTPQMVVIIPAHNEAATIAAAVHAARAAQLGEVVVVSDGSHDATAEYARVAGARVIELQPNRGKSAAVAAGLKATASRYVLMLDADLIGLSPAHLRALAAPVLEGRAESTLGLFTGGRLSTTLASWLTRDLGGQRVVPRASLDAIPDLEALRYALEIALTRQLRRERRRVQIVRLPGVTQRVKEEKHGLRRGLRGRIRMFGQIVRYALRH